MSISNLDLVSINTLVENKTALNSLATNEADLNSLAANETALTNLAANQPALTNLAADQTALTNLVAMNLRTLPIVCAYGIVVSNGVGNGGAPPVTKLYQTIAGFSEFINPGMNLFVQLIPIDFPAIENVAANLAGIIPISPAAAAPLPPGSMTWDGLGVNFNYTSLNANDNGVIYLVNVIIKF